MTPRGRRARTSLAGVVTALTVTLVAFPTPGGASVSTAKGVDPAAWTTRVCRQLVDFQAAALDAREVLWNAGGAAPPVDRATQKDSVRTIRTALAAVSASLTTLDRTLGKSAPAGRNGTTARDALRGVMAPVGAAYGAASRDAVDLATGAVGRLPMGTRTLLRKLDRAIDRATTPVTRAERTVRRSSVGAEVADQAVCRSIGFEWSMLPTPGGAAATPPPPAVTTEVPGSADLTAPELLLPGRYRPTAEIASLATQTAMTGLARTYFYGALPSVETGTSFTTDCPTADSANAQILGCYHDGRIYILAVSRPEVARIVAVTAAHEMLHAVYDAMADDERAVADALLAGYFDTTTDERLRKIVAQYDQRSVANRPNELHSLVPTQVAVMTPALDDYFASYFRDRAPVLESYRSYLAAFDELLGRYDALKAQAEGLRSRITGIRVQSDSVAGEANRLAVQIDALRAQGRLGESNALVSAQNDAVRRAQALNAEANRLIAEYNALLDQINAVAAELGGLESALRPLG